MASRLIDFREQVNPARLEEHESNKRISECPASSGRSDQQPRKAGADLDGRTHASLDQF